MLIRRLGRASQPVACAFCKSDLVVSFKQCPKCFSALCVQCCVDISECVTLGCTVRNRLFVGKSMVTIKVKLRRRSAKPVRVRRAKLLRLPEQFEGLEGASVAPAFERSGRFFLFLSTMRFQALQRRVWSREDFSRKVRERLSLRDTPDLRSRLEQSLERALERGILRLEQGLIKVGHRNFSEIPVSDLQEVILCLLREGCRSKDQLIRGVAGHFGFSSSVARVRVRIEAVARALIMNQRRERRSQARAANS